MPIALDCMDARDYLWRECVLTHSLNLPPTFAITALGATLTTNDPEKALIYAASSMQVHAEYQKHKKYYSFDADDLYKNVGIDSCSLRAVMKTLLDTGIVAKAQRYKLSEDTRIKIEAYVRLCSKNQIKEALYYVGPVIIVVEASEGRYETLLITGWSDAEKVFNVKKFYEGTGEQQTKLMYEDLKVFDAWRPVKKSDIRNSR